MKPDVILDDASGCLLIWPGILSEVTVDALDHELQWRQDTMRMFGRTLNLPRLTAWYGDSDAFYTYSGIRNEPLPWTPLLRGIRTRAQELTGAPFNSVLANRYADGSQSMSWHADNEAALGQEPRIASVSLGATRRFLLKHRKDGRRIEVALTHGSVLLMAGRLQDEWLHALPKTRQPVDLRINLTFRQVYQGSV